jgi:hypothetical protein
MIPHVLEIMSATMRLRSTVAPICIGVLLPLVSACREMPHDRYVALLTEATDTMRAREQRLDSTFHIGSYPRWDWDQDAGVLVFSDGGTAKVVADVQFVGDVSRGDSTFLWAWANETVDPRLRKAAEKARRYGLSHGIPRLKHAHWAASEVDGWEMTSLTGYINGSEGLYRAPEPDSTGYTFLVLEHVRWAPPNTPVSAILDPGVPGLPRRAAPGP